MSAESGKFIIATPGRSVCDDNARVLERAGRLRFIALGTRRGIVGVPPEHTRLNPAIGAATYVFGRYFSTYRGESLRFRLHPWFDRWVCRQITPGDHVISSYGYANASFRRVREHGGRTFLDGGNSHPENFWSVVSGEHRRWGCPHPPFAPHHYERSVAMMEDVDFVLSPSAYVTRSFLERGFKPEQILSNVYPLDLDCFRPATTPRPADRPLTLISTGMPSLRKGAPYLLEAFRIVRRARPDARLLLTAPMHSSMEGVMKKFADLPIEWSPGLPHAQLAARLRSADVFVLPSLEDGFGRTVAEAMACGLPVIVTPNTGAADLVVPERSGSIVPIRDAQAIAAAVLAWGEKITAAAAPPESLIDVSALSFAVFESAFLSQLRERGLIPR
ncbi:MAG: glycosyltransferase [Chthoniobacteraceae bacterium]